MTRLAAAAAAALFITFGRFVEEVVCGTSINLVTFLAGCRRVPVLLLLPLPLGCLVDAASRFLFMGPT